MSTEEKTQEEKFAEAFSEAAEEKETAEDGSDTEQKTDTTADESEEAGESKGEADGEEDWRAKAEAEQQAREQAEQRMRSWDGRLRKSNEDLAREREARKALEQRLTALEQSGKEEDLNKLQMWLDDYGDDEEFSNVADVVRDRLKSATASDDEKEEKQTADDGGEHQEDHQKEQHKEVDERVKAHFSAIEEKHSDWREMAGELDAWIEELPGKKALEYARVKKNGTAEEVIAMLDDMKESKQGDGKRNDATDDADAMAAVRHRSGSKRPKGRADKNDFDGAWDEAVGQD